MIDLTNELQPRNFTFDLIGPGAGIQLTRGSYRGRLVIPALRRTLYSDDGGKTWRMSEVMRSRLGTETAIVQLENGDLFRSDRMHGGETGLLRRIISVSSNGGDRFSEPTRDAFLLDPRAQGSLLQYTPRRIIHANCASTVQRRFLTLRISEDGKNWVKSVRINNDCGYSSMTKTRDFTIGILWEKTSSSPEVTRAARDAKDLVFEKYSLGQLGFTDIGR